ncbi:Serotonin N-acetyltransferase 1, chloroplastic, partial [Mucuna pruriens]
MAAMGVAAKTQTHLQLEGFASKSMELKWVRRRIEKTNLSSRPLFPIYISTDPRHVDPHHLRDLFANCNHSTRRFPTRLEPEPVDIHKLRIALSHSAVLVSVFCNLHHENAVPRRNSSPSLIADFFTQVSPSRDQLVGFGRAVSDYGLTASIYDVMVIPSLQRMGIGQMIVKKIVRMLTNRDIYDIAALCSENERLFFKACGFGDDVLGSTTMMYTRNCSINNPGSYTCWPKAIVCLISAHGLQHSTSLWKRQWFAVVWIDLNSKYCTKVVYSGSANPVWRTKFVIPVDYSAPNIQDLALNVEVYSIDPIFFTEKLHGSATVVLKEFLVKQLKNSDVSKPRQEEVGSYQLWKKKSSKPRGFIDILIRIYDEKKESNSHSGNKEGILLLDDGYSTQLTTEGGVRQTYCQKPQASIHQPEDHVQSNVPDSHSVPFTTTNYYDPYVGEPSYHEMREPSYYEGAGPSYHEGAGPSYLVPRTITPPPPPPPSNVGYIPTLLPRNDGLSPSYTDMSTSRAAPGQRVPAGVAMGLGAGALAAGAIIFGDDFMSGFDVPSGLGDSSFDIGIDPPF